MFFQKTRQNQHFFDLVFNPIDILGFFKPLNWEEEMEKWLVSPGKTYNPQFVYDDAAICTALIRAKKLRKVLPKIAECYADSSDWRAMLTHDLLVSQCADFDATISLLDAFVNKEVIDHDCAEKASNQLFGEVTKDEYNLAVRLVYEPAAEVLKSYLISEKERHIFDQAKLESIIHGFLHDFKGHLTEDEAEILRNKDVSEEQVGIILEKTARYMFDHSAGDTEIHVRLLKVEDLDHFGILPMSAEPFHYDICMPYIHKIPERRLSALNMMQVVAHELNTHLRVMISTDTLINQVSPHFRPGILMRTQRSLPLEGFATLNGDAYLENGEGDVLESMTIVVPDYVKQGHNFAETAKFIYDIYDLDPDMDFYEYHRIIWTILQSFFGSKDTSAHTGYSFPYHQVYILGAMRTLKEMARINQHNFEEPLSLMRYSELPLSTLRTINHIEHDLKQKLVPDPFEAWNFANLNPDILDPADYAKQLLLDL